MTIGSDIFSPDVKILAIMLDEGGRVKRSDFRKKYSMNYDTAKLALERLEAWRLVTYEAVGDRRDTVYWSLTEKGVKVAESLKEIDEYIRNE